MLPVFFYKLLVYQIMMEVVKVCQIHEKVELHGIPTKLNFSTWNMKKIVRPDRSQPSSFGAGVTFLSLYSL